MQARKVYWDHLQTLEQLIGEWNRILQKSLQPRLSYLDLYGSRFTAIKEAKGEVLRDFEGVKELVLQMNFSKIERLMTQIRGLM